jgi:ABC-type multidrug transport system fused ATPase/permease subunit
MYNKLMKGLICLFAFFGALAISLLYHGNNNTELINTMLGVSSFIFGIFFTYYLGISSSKFTKITEALRKDDKSTLAIYYHSHELKKEDHEKITKLIDDYLVNQIDYYLKDYPKTSGEYFKLFDYCQSITPSGYKEEIAYEVILDLLDESLENRKVVESQLSYKISFFEWFSLSLFAGVIVICMFILSNGSNETSLMIATISMGITAVLYLLYEIDNLQWKESKLIWIPLTQFFRDMGLLPYFPKSVFHRVRDNIKFKNEKVRLATYPRKYPNFVGKVVEEFTT